MKFSDFMTRLTPEMLKPGQRYTLTVKGAGTEKTWRNGGEIQIPVLRFVETPKMLLLNTGNLRTLIAACDDTAAMVGRKIEIWSEAITTPRRMLTIRLAVLATTTTGEPATMDPAGQTTQPAAGE